MHSKCRLYTRISVARQHGTTEDTPTVKPIERACTSIQSKKTTASMTQETNNNLQPLANCKTDYEEQASVLKFNSERLTAGTKPIAHARNKPSSPRAATQYHPDAIITHTQCSDATRPPTQHHNNPYGTQSSKMTATALHRRTIPTHPSRMQISRHTHDG